MVYPEENDEHYNDTGHAHVSYPEENEHAYPNQYEGTEQYVPPYDLNFYDESQEEGEEDDPQY